MKLKLTFVETCTHEVTVDWPDEKPLPEVGTSGDNDWFTVVDDSSTEWMKNGLLEVGDRELLEVSAV